jgi:malonyl-CoA O-methyltransferase
MRALRRLLGSEPEHERVDLREGYARWAPCYPPIAHNPLMRVEQNEVTGILSNLRACRALDVGTGTGRNVPMIALTGAETIVGIDLSLEMLTRAHAVALRACADACRLPFASGCFDLATASLMAGDLPRIAPWLREMGRVLKSGGHLIYSDFHPLWSTRGWRRTFRDAAGATVELPLATHTVDEHRRGLGAAGLSAIDIREPALADGTTGVLVVVHARKE